MKTKLNTNSKSESNSDLDPVSEDLSVSERPKGPHPRV